jgi:hypothetical protein
MATDPANSVPATLHPAVESTGTITEESKRNLALYPVIERPVVFDAISEMVMVDPVDVETSGAVTVTTVPSGSWIDRPESTVRSNIRVAASVPEMGTNIIITTRIIVVEDLVISFPSLSDGGSVYEIATRAELT